MIVELLFSDLIYHGGGIVEIGEMRNRLNSWGSAGYMVITSLE